MTALVLNPHAELVLHRLDRELTQIGVRAPVRGRPLRSVSVSRDREPAVFDVLRRVAEGRAVDAELDEAAWDRLAQIGLLVPEGEVPRRVRFRCAPDDPPAALVPGRARRATPPSKARLRVSPSLRYDGAERPPDEGNAPPEGVRRQRAAVRGPAVVNPFADGCAWAWVDLPDAAVASPLSIDGPRRDLFRRLSPGGAPPEDLDDAAAEALARAGVLVDPEDAARRAAAWAAARAEAGEAFRSRGYAALRGMIPPAMVAGLRRYYRDLVAEGHVGLDVSARIRYCAHNEPMARFIHRALTGLVSETAGEQVKPSYVYFASYKPGARLDPHRDRAQCPISISMLLDYDPDPDDLSPWPLHVESNAPGSVGGWAETRLGPGDGLFYRGADLAHWRPPLPERHRSTSLFLHYVPVAFTGTLD